MSEHATARPNDQEISRELLPPRLAAIGYVKIGMQRPGSEGGAGKSPMKIDHFRVTTREREGGNGNFVIDQDVHDEVGAKPTALDIRLPFDTRTENFYAQMVEYSGQSRVRQCDGMNAIDLRTGVGAICPRQQGQTCPCKPYGRLGVILEAAPTFGGLYIFRTTSWESVNSIQTALKMFEAQFGSLRGLPLRMRLYPAEVRYRQGGKERTATAYKVAVELRATYDEAREAALDYHRSTQIARREILQLAAGTTEGLRDLDLEDAPDIRGEFFPERPEESPRGLERVAEINARLMGTPTEPEPEPEPEPTDGAKEPAGLFAEDEPSGDEARDLFQRLQKKAADARERQLISAKQADGMEEIIAKADEDRARVGEEWLDELLAGGNQETRT